MHRLRPCELIVAYSLDVMKKNSAPIYAWCAPNLLKLTPRPLSFTPPQASAGSKESHLRMIHESSVQSVGDYSPIEEHSPGVQFVHQPQESILRFGILFCVGPY